MSDRGYYINSLKVWRDDMRRDQLRSRARLSSMVDMNHPSASDQQAIVDLRTNFLKQLDDALSDAK